MAESVMTEAERVAELRGLRFAVGILQEHIDRYRGKYSECDFEDQGGRARWSGLQEEFCAAGGLITRRMAALERAREPRGEEQAQVQRMARCLAALRNVVVAAFGPISSTPRDPEILRLLDRNGLLPRRGKRAAHMVEALSALLAYETRGVYGEKKP